LSFVFSFLNTFKGTIAFEYIGHSGVIRIGSKSPDGPKRKYYQLTEAGRQTLGQMNAYWQAIKKQADAIKDGR